jgi:hypothetical protein
VRIGRRIPVMLAGALALTLVGGVAAAVTAAGPATAKACVTSSGALRLSVGGKCASGQTAITLGARGPKGAPGKTGPRGPRGPQGPAGAPASGGATRVNLSQFLIDTGTTPPTHYLGTAGPVSLVATCAGTTAAPSLTLTLSAATESLTYTATDVQSNNGAAATVALSHGSAVSLGSVSLPADVANALITNDTLSDVITIVVGAQDGTQVTSTLDVEVNATPGDTACSVNGTLAAA